MEEEKIISNVYLLEFSFSMALPAELEFHFSDFSHLQILHSLPHLFAYALKNHVPRESTVYSYKSKELKKHSCFQINTELLNSWWSLWFEFCPLFFYFTPPMPWIRCKSWGRNSTWVCIRNPCMRSISEPYEPLARGGKKKMSHTFVLCFFLPLSNLYFIGLRMNFLNGRIMIEMVPDIMQKLILEKKNLS